MGRLITRPLGLLIVGVLMPGWAGGQQPSLQTKNVPAMTSDDPQAGLYADRSTQPAVEAMPVRATPAGWVRYFPASCGLSIALPRRPLEADLPISAQDKALFRSGSNSFYTDGSLTVIAAHFQTVTPTPASSIVDSFFQGLSESNGIKGLKYSAKPTDRSTRTDVAATYRADNWVELEGFIEVIGTHGWLIVAMHQQGRVQSKEKGRLILESALFDGPSCVD
jgi:hypothetical protein